MYFRFITQITSHISFSFSPIVSFSHRFIYSSFTVSVSILVFLFFFSIQYYFLVLCILRYLSYNLSFYFAFSLYLSIYLSVYLSPSLSLSSCSPFSLNHSLLFYITVTLNTSSTQITLPIAPCSLHGFFFKRHREPMF